MPAPETILNHLAALKVKFGMDEGVEKTKVGSLAKIKGASTIRNALAKLKKEGLVVYNGNMVEITAKGMDQADTDVNVHIPTNNDEKHQMIKEELKPLQCRLFDALADGRVHEKEEVRKLLGMQKNSTWRNLLASLVKIQVAEYPCRNTIRLTKDMFPVVPRPE